MSIRKTKRRISARERLLAQLESGRLITDDKKLEFVKNQINILNDRIKGLKKFKKTKFQTKELEEDKDFVIDIYRITTSYAKRSERRKTKGKSRKSLKQIKTVSFLKSVANRPGLITAYKEGKQGISPKEHKFILRKK